MSSPDQRLVEELLKRITILENLLASDRGMSSSRMVILDKEHDRILQRIAAMKNKYNSEYGHALTWSPGDLKLFNELKQRRDEIRRALGIKF